jgi:hypothetical protein
MDMEHGKTKTRFRTTIKTKATTEISIVYMVTMGTTSPKTSQDRGHDDRNPSAHNRVSCHCYHLRDVVVAMSKSVVANTIPMMGEHEEKINPGKSHSDHNVSNTSDYDCFS